MGVTSNLLLHQCNLLYALEIITKLGINKRYIAGCKSFWEEFQNVRGSDLLPIYILIIKTGKVFIKYR